RAPLGRRAARALLRCGRYRDAAGAGRMALVAPGADRVPPGRPLCPAKRAPPPRQSAPTVARALRKPRATKSSGADAATLAPRERRSANRAAPQRRMEPTTEDPRP